MWLKVFTASHEGFTWKPPKGSKPVKTATLLSGVAFGFINWSLSKTISLRGARDSPSEAAREKKGRGCLNAFTVPIGDYRRSEGGLQVPQKKGRVQSA